MSYRESPEKKFYSVTFETDLSRFRSTYTQCGHTHLVSAISEEKAVEEVEECAKQSGFSPISRPIAKLVSTQEQVLNVMSPDEVFAYEAHRAIVKSQTKLSFFWRMWNRVFGG